LLADATKEVFDLQTQRKENQHKIDRLQDYERQIEQHLKVQRLWYDISLVLCLNEFITACRDEDFAKFNERENDIKLIQSQYKQMEMRLESTEKNQEELEENARYSLKCFPCSII
jgi:flagellar biosynthesis chaperone FliJ